MYRNSLKAANTDDVWRATFPGAAANTHENENNVLEKGDAPTGAEWVNTNNLEDGSNTETYFDANNDLTGTWRTNNLGTHGAEVSAYEAP